MHNGTVGAFRSLDRDSLDTFSSQPPPDNCPVCQLLEERESEMNPRGLKDEHGAPNGVVYGGKNYHCEDFVLFRSDKGPAHIGYVTNFNLKKREPTVTVRKVGRIADIVLPADVLKDEVRPKASLYRWVINNMFPLQRQLYLTDEEATIRIDILLKVIYVPCIESIQGSEHDLEDWLALSSDHFYVEYSFPRIDGVNWNARRRIGWEDLHVCTSCCKERLLKRKLMYQFLDVQKRKPLRTLDLFGGVGAFSHGLINGSDSLKITAAIEISPSAAKTFAYAYPPL